MIQLAPKDTIRRDTPPAGADEARAELRSRADLTSVAWVPGRELGYSDWVQYGGRLGVAGRSSGWWIGDWVRYGAARYGQRYVVAARVTGYDDQTLMNMVYVATHFEISRRREGLSWSHHAELASLSTGDQEHWLNRAVGERLSVRALRRELLSAREANELSAPTPDDPRHSATVGAGDTPADGEALAICPVCGHRFAFRLTRRGSTRRT